MTRKRFDRHGELTPEQRKLTGVNSVARGDSETANALVAQMNAPVDPGGMAVKILAGATFTVLPSAPPEPPTVYGLSMVRLPTGKWLVVRGRIVDYESLSPLRNGEHSGESLHASTARMMEAFRREVRGA